MRAAGLMLLFIGACDPATPQGMFQPRKLPVVASAPAPTEDEDLEDEDTGDAEADAEDGEVEELTPEELAAAMGLAPDEPLVPEIGPPDEEEPPPEVAAPPIVTAPAPPRWDPSQALDGSWGIRLVSTTSMAQPPRAMLGLPNGREEAVKPGDLLPEAGVVVLGIGRDVVQIAQITPQGDHARVDSQTLRAMYPEGQGGFGR